MSTWGQYHKTEHEIYCTHLYDLPPIIIFHHLMPVTSEEDTVSNNKWINNQQHITLLNFPYTYAIANTHISLTKHRNKLTFKQICPSSVRTGRSGSIDHAATVVTEACTERRFAGPHAGCALLHLARELNNRKHKNISLHVHKENGDMPSGLKCHAT